MKIGLVAVGTKLDPSLTRQDRLVGQIIGRVGQMPPVFSALEIKYSLMKRVVGGILFSSFFLPLFIVQYF